MLNQQELSEIWQLVTLSVQISRAFYSSILAMDRNDIRQALMRKEALKSKCLNIKTQNGRYSNSVVDSFKSPRYPEKYNTLLHIL